MSTISNIGAGLAGATALTLIHETVRRIDPNAPRMDLLGMNALSKILRKFHKSPPDRDKLFLITMAGDLVSNTLYYSAAGLGDKRNVWLNGIFLGLAAGIGGVLLPKPLGLNEDYSARTAQTKLMTVGLYLIGGLVTSAALSLMQKRKPKKMKWS